MRRGLAVLVTLTVLLLLLDVAGGPTGPVRSAGASVFGPMLRATSTTRATPVTPS